MSHSPSPPAALRFVQGLSDFLRQDLRTEAPLRSACTQEMVPLDARQAAPQRLDYIIIANRGIIASMIIHEAHKAGKKLIVLREQEDLPYFDHLLDVTAGDIVLPVELYKDTRNRGKARLDVQSIARIRAITDAMQIPPERIAIHPGYGFNSEDPEWNEEVCRYFKVLAPSHAWIRLLGNKMEANLFCQETQIPLPVSAGNLTDKEEARAFFRRHRGSVQRFLFKDCFGGGGKGQMEVDASVPEEEFLALFEQFSSRYPSFIINEFIVSNRHIEMQVMVDREGSIRFGPMRDCTLQRAKQKIIEEIAVEISPEQVRFLRKNITDFFQRGAEKLGHPYEGLATFEMMYLPTEKKFYFLEVNTRIQVEHPVSGHQGGIQFIQTQWDIAEGKRLKSQKQLDAEERGGHTMEARICFERFLSVDERTAFKKTMGVDIVSMPESGQPIRSLTLPAGRHITVYMDQRLDGGDGRRVVHMPRKQYDSMVMQVVSRGRDRQEARRHLITALEALQVEGLQTNREFVLILLRDARFIKGAVTSDMPIVQEAMERILQQVEVAHHAQQRQKRRQQTDALLLAVQRQEVPLAAAWGQWDLPHLLASQLGPLKPTIRQIQALLQRLGLSPEALQQQAKRTVICRGALDVLLHDLLDTLPAFAVQWQNHPAHAPELHFFVPHIIEPLFICYIQRYGGVDGQRLADSSG
ncbi:MAG: hypothetical protein HQL88_03660 [Magnetococcales bacterium]|nr:hypothetical protein [Magnetococcales bacterium]